MKLAELFESPVTDRYKIYDLSELTGRNDTQHLADIIKQNCKIMLKSYQDTGKILYRGISTTTDGYDAQMTSMITGIRKDRKPVCMPTDFHNALNSTFKKLGLPVTRTNSIFCSTDKWVADAWGTTCAIFVKDGWEGLVFDFKRSDYTYMDFHSILDIDCKKDEWEDEITKVVNRLRPRLFSNSQELNHILDVEFKDILITGDSYIAVRLNKGWTTNPQFHELMQLLDIKLR